MVTEARKCGVKAVVVPYDTQEGHSATYREPEDHAGLRPCTPASSKELNISCQPGDAPGLWSCPASVRYLSGVVLFKLIVDIKKSGTV